MAKIIAKERKKPVKQVPTPRKRTEKERVSDLNEALFGQGNYALREDLPHDTRPVLGIWSNHENRRIEVPLDDTEISNLIYQLLESKKIINPIPKGEDRVNVVNLAESAFERKSSPQTLHQILGLHPENKTVTSEKDLQSQTKLQVFEQRLMDKLQRMRGPIGSIETFIERTNGNSTPDLKNPIQDPKASNHLEALDLLCQVADYMLEKLFFCADQLTELG